ALAFGCILVGFGGTAVAFSMEEMASMYAGLMSTIRPSLLTSCRDPVIGAQYRWSANFAPFAPRFLGLDSRYQQCSLSGWNAHTRIGWLTVSAWTINCAGLPAIIANNIIGLALFHYENYQPKPWHTTLMMWGLIMVPFLFNLRFRQLLNTFELLGGICHIV